MREKQRCPHCGTRPDEWDETKGGDRDAYVADLHTCWGCNAQQAFEANLDRSTLVKGTYVVLRRRRTPR